MPSLYGFAYHEAALAYLEKIRPGSVRASIKRRIEKLAAHPFPPDRQRLAMVLDGRNPIYRVWVGDYKNPLLGPAHYHRDIGYRAPEGRLQVTAGKQQVDPDKLRMDEGEFDRIMRKALQVKPEGDKPKKTKAPRKKAANNAA